MSELKKSLELTRRNFSDGLISTILFTSLVNRFLVRLAAVTTGLLSRLLFSHDLV